VVEVVVASGRRKSSIYGRTTGDRRQATRRQNRRRQDKQAGRARWYKGRSSLGLLHSVQAGAAASFSHGWGGAWPLSRAFFSPSQAL
jgi:hypothetical protein